MKAQLSHIAILRKYLIYLQLVALAVPCLSMAQKSAVLPQDTLATVGSSAITARDLLLRLELMPFPGKQSKTEAETLKASALYAMIAEKVLARAASRQGLSEDENTAFMKRELENLFIRDELYKREIAAHAAPSQGEILEGLSRFTKEICVLSFLVRSEQEGAALAGMLRAAKSGSVLQTIARSSYMQVDTIIIQFGGPDTAFENAAYEIDTSRISKILHSGNGGWAVLYLLDGRSNISAARLGLPDRRRRVEQILRGRHEAELVGKYTFEVLKSRSALADSLIFNALADSISCLWREDTSAFKNRGRFILTSDLVELMMIRLKPLLSSTLVTIDDGNLSLRQVLEMFRYLDFTSTTYQGDEFKLELNAAIKDLVARELLAREGRRLGLHNTRAVQTDLQLWTDYWLARALYYQVREWVSVSDEDIIRHILKNISVFGLWYQVNVRELLTSDLSAIAIAVDELNRGRALDELAGTHSKRLAWAAQGGESGYFNISEHPEIGVRALLAGDSGLVGPVKLPEGYSIFRVLDRRRTDRARTGIDTLLENVRRRLLNDKRTEALDRYVAEQAREQRVVINSNKLRQVSYNQAPMFTRRFIGFGGRLAATPLLMQLWDWIMQFKQPSSILP